MAAVAHCTAVDTSLPEERALKAPCAAAWQALGRAPPPAAPAAPRPGPVRAAPSRHWAHVSPAPRHQSAPTSVVEAGPAGRAKPAQAGWAARPATAASEQERGPVLEGEKQVGPAGQAAARPRSARLPPAAAGG